MSKDRWQLLDRLYHAALECEPAARAEFVANACEGDEELRSELAALLAYDDRAVGFMERQALEIAGRALAFDPQFESTENDVPATGRIGHYVLQGLLGEGGMGKVYLALDTRLGRRVAIKQLPAALMADVQQLRRFEQEARLASGLNHPNIITIHEIGQATSEAGRQTHYIVAEYIDGETLRQRMTSAPFKRLQPPEALHIAMQIADALSAAHEAGVIHRDIKPENVMLRRDGYAKVLDFGLAKLTLGQTSESEADVSTAQVVRTNPGLILGTTSYMSPEQARGLKVDARTDIFSLGAVIYEMLAGEPAFKGETASDVMAYLLTRQPATLSSFKPAPPVELERIVDKCLARDCSDRYQTTRELIDDLRSARRLIVGHQADDSYEREVVRAGEGEIPAPKPMSSSIREAALRRFSGKVIVLLVSPALVLASFLVLAGYFRAQPAPAPEKVKRLVSSGNILQATISPNGEYLAYVNKKSGRQSLHLMLVATGKVIEKIPDADVDYWGLTFSPDRNYLYYVASDLSSKPPGEPLSALYSVPLDGGIPQKIMERLDSPISFSPDGERFAFVREQTIEGISVLIVCDSDGGRETKLAERRLPFYFDYPAWSPDGNVIACVATGYSEGKHLAFFDPQGKVIINAASAEEWPFIYRIQWMKGSDRLVLSVSDPERGSTQLWTDSYPEGHATRITNDLNDHIGVSLTADSRQLVSIEKRRLTSIWTATKSQESYSIHLARPVSDYDKVSWAPDGRIIYGEKSGEDWNIWAAEADGNNPRQLTFGLFGDREASLSPDGHNLVFVRTSRNRTTVWAMNVEDGNPREVSQQSTSHAPALSPNGEWIVYTAPSLTKWSVLWRIPMQGGRSTQLNDAISRSPSISPDGKLIACFYLDERVDSQMTRMSMAVIPVEGGVPAKIFETSARVNQPAGVQWTEDGKALTYVDSRSGHSNIWSQPLEGGPPTQITGFKDEEIFSFDWSKDGKRLVLLKGSITSDVVLMGLR
jgi:eukaryotic-like serine/threonine-protein kinase